VFRFWVGIWNLLFRVFVRWLFALYLCSNMTLLDEYVCDTACLVIVILNIPWGWPLNLSILCVRCFCHGCHMVEQYMTLGRICHMVEQYMTWVRTYVLALQNHNLMYVTGPGATLWHTDHWLADSCSLLLS